MLAKRIYLDDLVQVKKWHEDRGINCPDLSYFPPTGFIIDDIAAGFILYTDSGIALIDGYISNPNCKKSEREKALNLITRALIESAKKKGCNVIKCDTKLDCIKIRATKHGFKSLGVYESFAMEIK